MGVHRDGGSPCRLINVSVKPGELQCVPSLTWLSCPLLHFCISVDDAIQASTTPVTIQFQASVRSFGELAKSVPDSVPTLTSRFSIESLQLSGHGLYCGFTGLLNRRGWLLIARFPRTITTTFRLGFVRLSFIRLSLILVLTLDGINDTIVCGFYRILLKTFIRLAGFDTQQLPFNFVPPCPL